MELMHTHSCCRQQRLMVKAESLPHGSAYEWLTFSHCRPQGSGPAAARTSVHRLSEVVQEVMVKLLADAKQLLCS